MRSAARRLSLAVLAVGAGLLAAAAMTSQPASGEPSRAMPRGGTLRIDLTSDFDYTDTSLAYSTSSWQMLNATKLTLLLFPDREGLAGRRIVPDAATGLPKVSKDGKTYTFTIGKDHKFSNGATVTADNFRAAIARAFNPRMQSPALPFLDDVHRYSAPNSTTLTVKLRKVAPDFLARMTMPFFSAIPTNTPIVPGGIRTPLPSAGPYYVQSWDKGRTAVLVRNRFYGGHRQGMADRVAYNLNIPPAQQRSRCESGTTDICTALQPTDYARMAVKYGINRGRFFAKPRMALSYLSLNNNSPLFRGNEKLRQAVNYVIDRPQMIRQHGAFAGPRTDQIIPPGMPGFRYASIYPLHGPSLGRARALARGNTRGGRAVFYTSATAPGPQLAQVVKFNLSQIGIDVEVKALNDLELQRRTGRRGERFDIAFQGWDADYPDPFDFIDLLLNGNNIHATNNSNDSYFNDPAYNRKLEQATALSGKARTRAYGNLDIELMRKQAPIVPYLNPNDRFLVSANVERLSYHPIYGINVVASSLKGSAIPPPPPPPPPPPSCSLLLTATETMYGTPTPTPHIQVFAQCDGFFTAGLDNFRVDSPAGKTISVYRAYSTFCETGPAPVMYVKCKIKPDGRVCFIFQTIPPTTAGEVVRARLQTSTDTVLEDKNLTVGAQQPPCNVGD